MLISCHLVVSLSVFYNSKANPDSPLPSVSPGPDQSLMVVMNILYIISQWHREINREKIEQVDLGSMDRQVEVKKVKPSSACPALAHTGQSD